MAKLLTAKDYWEREKRRVRERTGQPGKTVRKKIRRTKPVDAWTLGALGLIAWSIHWVWTSPVLERWCVGWVGAEAGPAFANFLQLWWTLCAAILLWKGLTRPNVTEEIVEEEVLGENGEGDR